MNYDYISERSMTVLHIDTEDIVKDTAYKE